MKQQTNSTAVRIAGTVRAFQKQTTGVGVREAASVVQTAFDPATEPRRNDAVVRVFLPADHMPAVAWSGGEREEPRDLVGFDPRVAGASARPRKRN